ncbi:hypothetical protein R5W23_003798 [Gemmata sp. JC673]|uniref:Uncharacterized protein n=1 Tax=Gemmata algarum TaxID=2975278 RepID=A0ABU5F7N2_9BACT|nr:hypothetical protein [Gemmata algarum]MDY3562333.1 hypothetical protein [Gemmata algarum]
MDHNIVENFVAQIHYLVTVPAYRASLGFLAAAGRGNPKYASFKAAADLYQRCTDDERRSLNDFCYSAIHYACFSFLQFLEEYSEQDEGTEGKKIELRLIEADADTPPVDLFALSQNQLRTLFRRYTASEEWKAFLSKLAPDKSEGEV